MLDVELGDLIRFEQPKAEWMRLEAASQEEPDRLMDRNNDGRLTQAERVKFDASLERAERITLHNAQILVDQKLLQESPRRGRTRSGRVETAR